MKPTNEIEELQVLIERTLRKKTVLLSKPHIGEDMRSLLSDFETIAEKTKEITKITKTIHDADKRVLQGKAQLAEYRIQDLQSIVFSNLQKLVKKLNGDLKEKVQPEVTSEINSTVREIVQHIKV